MDDYELDNELTELNEELSDYADNMARSEDDGWFYGDGDPT